MELLERPVGDSGRRPVDADPRAKHLEELVSQRNNLSVARAVDQIEFRDDRVTTNEGAFGMEDISPYGLRTRIEASRVPMMVWCGWLDEKTCEGTLIRYRTFSNPQVVIIGPLSHGGNYNVDPFGPKHTPPVPPSEEQFKMEADFFDRVLRNNTPEAIESSIQYYTMGEGRWHTTKTWPPEGLSVERLYFGESNMLAAAAPSATTGSDSYTVDFTASTGKRTRWHTGLSGGDVVYPDRAAGDDSGSAAALRQIGVNGNSAHDPDWLLSDSGRITGKREVGNTLHSSLLLPNEIAGSAGG